MKRKAKNAVIFTKAHRLTRRTLQRGDSYSATFMLCLKHEYSESKRPKKSFLKRLFL